MARITHPLTLEELVGFISSPDNNDLLAPSGNASLSTLAKGMFYNDLTNSFQRFRGTVDKGLLVMPNGFSSNNITVTGAPNAIATATLLGFAGVQHYITHLSIKRVATAALAGGAILTVTTTNLGGRAWRTGNQASITVGTFDPAVLIDADFSHPIRSTASGVNTTIVCPAPGAGVSWQINVDYYNRGIGVI